MWRRAAGSVKDNVLRMKRGGGAERRRTHTLKGRHRWLTGAWTGEPAAPAAKGTRPTLPSAVSLGVGASQPADSPAARRSVTSATFG